MAIHSVVIAKNKKPLVKLLENDFKKASGILSSYLERITGAESFERVPATCVDPMIVLEQKQGFKNDGFGYRIFDKDIIIEASTQKGMVHAVYDFLERVVGCRYYTSREEYLPFDANLSVCFEEYSFEPILQYREVYYRDFADEAFAEKHKMAPAVAGSEEAQHKGWGFWCHSFQELVNPDIYFEEHPEYFSMYEGKRVGQKAQLCLSNPEVLELLCDNLQKHMEQKPEALYWSVSQNDNNAYCSCESCKKIDEEQGSPMGSVLNFVNRVAERFPDKIISTLAYWYTRKPPKTICPAKNVHIMLCNIEANRGLPIETDERSRDSREELLAWKKICGNVFLWDYCIQFRNLVSPFPNLRVLAPNIRFFVENNVRSLFSQCNREVAGEMCELRGYLLAKLMWNPYCNPDEVIEDFTDGYYKQAAPYIRRYIDIMHDALEHTGGELSIFGSPKEEQESFLTKELFFEYELLFDQAEAAAEGDDETLFRVKTARLPIYYAGIYMGYAEKERLFTMIAEFASQAKKIGLEKVEEWVITVERFITDSMAELAGDNLQR